MTELLSARAAACIAFVAAWALPLAAHAAQAVDFAGKKIEILVPFPPAGGADVYIRALVPHLEKHLPGRPTLIVRNVPGAGSIAGANQFQARAKPDGLHAIALSISTVSNYVFQRSRVQYDLEKWEPVLLSPQGNVVYAATGLGVTGPKDIARLKGHKLLFGGHSPTSAEMRTVVALELLGLNLHFVWGLARGPTRLAFERGELNINYDSTPGYIKNATALVKAGKAVPLFSFGVADENDNIVRDPNFPELPTFPEAYELAHGKKPAGPAYEAWRALFTMGVMTNKGIFLPANTPQPILEAWRSATRKMLEDPDFQKDAANIIEGYPQIIGERARTIVKEATTLSPEVWEWLRKYLKERHNVTL